MHKWDAPLLHSLQALYPSECAFLIRHDEVLMDQTRDEFEMETNALNLANNL
jgi:hypothetical protein